MLMHHKGNTVCQLTVYTLSYTVIQMCAWFASYKAIAILMPFTLRGTATHKVYSLHKFAQLSHVCPI